LGKEDWLLLLNLVEELRADEARAQEEDFDCLDSHQNMEVMLSKSANSEQ
jgi:hypothetical protein